MVGAWAEARGDGARVGDVGNIVRAWRQRQGWCEGVEDHRLVATDGGGGKEGERWWRQRNGVEVEARMVVMV